MASWPDPMIGRGPSGIGGDALRHKRFKKTNIAGARPSAEGTGRTANLNVRATPEEYLRWRSAADSCGMSLSAWVASWLDELAGIPTRALRILEKLAPHHGGRVPIFEVERVMWQRWGWSEAEVRDALSHLAELDLIVLFTGPVASHIKRPELRTGGGVVVTHVGLPTRARRPRKPIP